jgi:hypothetical protein
MTNLWFDQEALIAASREKGEDIQICELEISQNLNTAYGIPQKKEWKCRPLQAYSISQKDSVLAINTGGASTVEDMEEFVYVFSKEFHPSQVTKNTYFLVGKRINQIELVDTVVHRGVTLLYKYKIQETSNSLDQVSAEN